MTNHNTTENIIPENTTGKSVDLRESVELVSAAMAREHFELVCSRLKDPSSWHELAGAASAKFTPYIAGKTGDGYIEKGSLIQIDLPAPGPSAGEGHDWVSVDQVSTTAEKDADEAFGLTLKVAENPNQPGKGIAHFFGEGATSTILVKRKDNRVEVSYHGRNEKPNLENEGLTDKIRNTVVALGAMAGISELQWKALLSGLVSLEKN